MSRNYKIQNQKAIYFVTCTVVNWIDVFTRIEYKNIIVDSLNYCIKNKGLNIFAWVLMTNHIHLLVSTETGPLENVLRDFKKYTAKSLLKEIEDNPQESRKNWLLWMFHRAGIRHSAKQTYQLWQPHNHPLEVSPKGEKMYSFIRYIHYNPVKAGFVEKEEEYWYSSARDFAGEKGLVHMALI